MELAARRAIKELGGNDTELKEYSNPDSQKYENMVSKISENLEMDTLHFQRLDDLVEAVGLTKERLCTHCWDGTSYF
jgi:amidophosphoribosyltransferase